jgi:cytochrome c oxidase assembly protein subunit 15
MIIFTRLNLYVALAHAFFISVLFGVFSYFILLVSRSKKNAANIKKQNPVDLPPATAK